MNFNIDSCGVGFKLGHNVCVYTQYLNKIPPSKNDENALGNCIITFYLKGFLTSEK